MAEEYKIVRSPVLEDQELPEIHYHNDVDQPAISLGDLPAGTDHSTLSNVTIDQHHARDHASRHLSGGGDALTLTATEVPTSAWAADIIPALDSAYDLGSTTKAFRTVYVDTIKSITGNALALTPISGQSLTINLATTGDFIVNTDDLVVDTSTGNVGIGTTGPATKLEVSGTTRTTRLDIVDAATYIYRTSANDFIFGSNSGDQVTLSGGIFRPSADNNVALGWPGYRWASLRVAGDAYIEGNVGIGLTTPTAVLHLKAGTATANTAPFKLTAGTNLTTPEAGAIEFDGTNLYFTDSGGTRRQLAVV